MAEETITLPRSYADKALQLGEDHIGEITTLRESVETYRAEVAPIVAEYGAELRARAEARARVTADKLEERSLLRRFVTHPAVISVLSILGTSIATYLAGAAGLASPAFRAAPSEEAPHAAAP